MKKALDASQMIELRMLGYMKDDSLAGLIEFQIESLNKSNLCGTMVRFEICVRCANIVNQQYEIVKKILEDKKHDNRKRL